MTSMTVEQAVELTAGRYADTHPSIVSGVIANYNEGGPEQAKQFLIRAGHSGFTSYVDEVSRLVNDPSLAEPTDVPGSNPFSSVETTDVQPGSVDPQVACQVIRAFLIDEEGYSNEEVAALLVLAGLEDEVVPEPEPEPFGHEVEADDTASVLARIESTLSGLVGFARGHGYSG